MSIARPIKRYTPQEYYHLERVAEYKSEYYHGEIFAMAGGTIRHSLICSNIIRHIGNRLQGKPCTAYESNLRLRILSTGLRCYPDVSIVCGQTMVDPEDETGETVTNPTVLIEVLSPTTEGYDRGTKARNYRQIESLQAYIFVSQDEPLVEIFLRQPGGSWEFDEVMGMEAVVAIPPIDVQLPLGEVYDRVEFDAPT